jgi:hypothetical protein
MTTLHVATGPGAEYNDHDFDMWANAVVFGIFEDRADAEARVESELVAFVANWDPHDFSFETSEKLADAARAASSVVSIDVCASTCAPLGPALDPWRVPGATTVWAVMAPYGREGTPVRGLFHDPRDGAELSARIYAEERAGMSDEDIRWGGPTIHRVIPMVVITPGGTGS